MTRAMDSSALDRLIVNDIDRLSRTFGISVVHAQQLRRVTGFKPYAEWNGADMEAASRYIEQVYADEGTRVIEDTSPDIGYTSPRR